MIHFHAQQEICHNNGDFNFFMKISKQSNLHVCEFKLKLTDSQLALNVFWTMNAKERKQKEREKEADRQKLSLRDYL